MMDEMKGLFFLFLICLVLLSCTEEEPVAPDPLTSSTLFLRILSGTLNVVQISGGIPPYHIIEGPLPNVATVSFEDSTASPAKLLIRGSSGGLGDTTTVVVSDSDPINRSRISITIQLVVDGVSYTANIQPIWDIYCKDKGCHPGGGSPFSLDGSVSYNNLTFAAVSNTGCGAVYRVVPFNPDSSLLYLRISGRIPCPRMPLSQTPGDTLALFDQLNIWAWIIEGAVNN